MNLILVIIVVFLLLIGNEMWWRRHAMHSELSRKFIHVTVGSFVAFWPNLLSWQQIQLLSIAFLVIVGVSKYLHIFRAIHSVQRPTWGELFFAIAVGFITLITHDKAIYTASLLQMSLADGLAAIIGTRFGNHQKYLILGYTKSLVGTFTFFVVSLLILLGLSHFSAVHLHTSSMIGISATASIIENIAIRGLDNLLVPVAVALLLVYR